MNTSQTRKSWLPPSGGNLFQTIKQKTREAEEKGIKIIKLSIGQPTGPALSSARSAAALAVASEAESMHEYQDNGSPGVPDFARRFAQCHIKTDLSTVSEDRVAFLPIPGIKPMLMLIPLACGASEKRDIIVRTMTDPGYPTPYFWCGKMIGVHGRRFTLNPENKFLFPMDDLTDELETGDLLMLNYPHNPSGKAASREWLMGVCDFASKHGIRIFNDAAYAILAHSDVHTTLADVALGFPNLSWAEAYSASKAGNFTGWRIGAIIGSSDFVGDIATIKGDADSGFAAPMAAGVLWAFENDMSSILQRAAVYADRIKVLTRALGEREMRLAVCPDAGFFTLWLAPKRAFGVNIGNAGYFNDLMIEQTGVVGVPFHPYIRYSVTGPVQKMLPEIEVAFTKAAVSY